MQLFNNYLRTINEAQPSDGDADGTEGAQYSDRWGEEYDSEDPENPANLPWYSDENGDGWNKDDDTISDLIYLLEDFSQLEYELKNCRRGSYCLSGDTAESLLEKCQELYGTLGEVIENLEMRT